MVRIVARPWCSWSGGHDPDDNDDDDGGLFLGRLGCDGLGSDVKSGQQCDPLSDSYYCPPTIMIGTASS